jgi:hypothetical protein
MVAEVHTADGNELDKMAQLLARIADRSVSAEEADQLTDRMSRLIWAVSEIDLQAKQTVDYSIHDAAHQQLHNL